MTVEEKLMELYFCEGFSEPSRIYFRDKNITWLFTDNDKLLTGACWWPHREFVEIRGTSCSRAARHMDINGKEFWFMPVSGERIMYDLMKRGWRRLNDIQLKMEIGG